MTYTESGASKYYKVPCPAEFYDVLIWGPFDWHTVTYSSGDSQNKNYMIGFTIAPYNRAAFIYVYSPTLTSANIFAASIDFFFIYRPKR